MADARRLDERPQTPQMVVGVRGVTMVLTEVLRPRRHEERLHESLRVGEVPEQRPLVPAGAPAVAFDVLHQHAELVELGDRHPVRHAHEHRAIVGRRVDHDLRIGARDHREVELVLGGERPAQRRQRAQRHHDGGDQVCSGQVPVGGEPTQRAADREAAGEDEGVEGQAASPHPRRQRRLAPRSSCWSLPGSTRSRPRTALRQPRGGRARTPGRSTRRPGRARSTVMSASPSMTCTMRGRRMAEIVAPMPKQPSRIP